MEIYEMLQELYEMVVDEEIIQDSHDHDTEWDMHHAEFCKVCFVRDLYLNVSEQDPEFTEETTEKQRKVIEDLWERYCNS